MNEQMQEKKKGNINEEVFEWMESIVFSIVIVVLIFTFIVRVVLVSGDSMNNTLFNEDKVIVSKVFYQPKQGDVIVTTDHNGYGKPLIKRVIATGGQTVDIDFENRIITVNGVVYSDEHAYYDPLREFTAEDGVTYPVTVEEGKLFCMGDNRCNSLDSRSARVGCISENDIIGRAYLRLSPGFKLL